MSFTQDFYNRDTNPIRYDCNPRPGADFTDWMQARSKQIVTITRSLLGPKVVFLNDSAVRNMWVKLIDGERNGKAA